MKLLQTKEKFRLKLFIIYEQLKREKIACFFEGFLFNNIAKRTM